MGLNVKRLYSLQSFLSVFCIVDALSAAIYQTHGQAHKCTECETNSQHTHIFEFVHSILVSFSSLPCPLLACLKTARTKHSTTFYHTHTPIYLQSLSLAIHAAFANSTQPYLSQIPQLCLYTMHKIAFLLSYVAIDHFTQSWFSTFPPVLVLYFFLLLHTSIQCGCVRACERVCVGVKWRVSDLVYSTIIQIAKHSE